MSLFGAITRVDLGILRPFSELLGRAPRFDALVEIVAANDLVKGGLLVGLLCLFWHEPHRDQSKRRQVIVAAVAGACVAALVSRSLCHLLPSRTRPFLTPGLHLAVPFPAALYPDRHGSFPSDHAALAFGLATGFFLLSPWLGLALTAYVIVFVCLPRLYLGLHWPSDLVAGAVIGSMFTASFSLRRVRTALAGPPQRLLSRSPGLFYAAMFLVAFGLMTRFDSARVLGRVLANWVSNALLHH